MIESCENTRLDVADFAPRSLLRRLALCRLQFRWDAGIYWRGRVAFPEEALDAWSDEEFARRLTRWHRRRPTPRRKEAR